MTIPGWEPTQLILDCQDPKFDPLSLFRMFRHYMKRRQKEKDQFEEYNLGNWVFNKTRGNLPYVRDIVKNLLTVWEALGLIKEDSKPLGSGPGGNWAVAIWVFQRG